MASVVTQAISAIVGLALLLRGRAGVNLRGAYVRIRPEIQRRIFSIGIPSSLNSAARGISFIAMAAIVAGISTTAIAAYGIGQRVFSFVIIPALGFAIATSTVVGQNVGARRNDRVIETIKAAVGIAFTSLTAIGALLVIFAPRIVAFFVPGEAAVIAMGSRFLRIAGLTFGLIGIQMIVSGALRGADAPRAALYITLINLFVIQVPLAWLLAHTSLAATGVWISIAAANLVAAIIALVWFRVKDWHAVEPA